MRCKFGRGAENDHIRREMVLRAKAGPRPDLHKKKEENQFTTPYACPTSNENEDRTKPIPSIIRPGRDDDDAAVAAAKERSKLLHAAKGGYMWFDVCVCVCEYGRT